MKELSGDLALITGGGRGIGAAIAQELGEQGAKILIADLDADVCEERVRRFRNLGIDADYVVVDVSDKDAARRVAQDVEAKHGDISILVNNAGTTGRADVDSEETWPLWDKIIQVNLDGVFYMTAAFVEQLKRTKGRIVSVSSVVGLRSGFTNVGYSASKGGVKSLTQQLARDLAQHGIRVNAIAPGYIDSGLGMKGNPQAEEWLGWHCPMKRFGEPHELAGPVAFLVSSKATFITGVTLPVDGGYLVI